jgi:two-component system, chemotaxis family, CheB/CheR fusion protein
MPLRILVVDDNADTAASLSFLCQSWGHEVCVAHDGPAAVEAARDFRPDALVLDIGLPGLDGFEVAKRLRSLPAFQRTLIVAASGYGREEDRRRARKVGIDLYLVKPFNPWRLETVFTARRPASETVPA